MKRRTTSPKPPREVLIKMANALGAGLLFSSRRSYLDDTPIYIYIYNGMYRSRVVCVVFWEGKGLKVSCAGVYTVRGS